MPFFLVFLLVLSCVHQPSNLEEAPEAPPFVPYTSEFRNKKNIIIMINDGASWGTWQAASYWEFGELGQEAYDNFPVKLGVTTYPQNTSSSPTYSETIEGSYDPSQAWDTTPMAGRLAFKGYQYLAQNYTDSAAGGTALASGQKTYNNSINTDNFGRPLPFITEIARRLGKKTGVVTTVEFSHATPAAFGAVNETRNNLTEIAHSMLHSGLLHLIMGGGHPYFDSNGRRRSEGQFNKVTQEDWELLVNGKLIPAGSSAPWYFVETVDQFQQLARGTLPNTPHLIGIFQSHTTTQQARSLTVMGADPNQPSGIARIPNTPDLATLSRGALNFLSKGDGGFFLMIEGGATDWAAHTSNRAANEIQYGQLIEETVDFNRAVRAVVEWIETNSSWNDTLLIVTTDHGNGLYLGPDADRIPFQPVQNRGKGRLPGLSARPIGTHTNELVLLWAKGYGAQGFFQYIRGKDPNFARYVGFNDGSYIDNTDVFKVMRAVIEAQP